MEENSGKRMPVLVAGGELLARCRAGDGEALTRVYAEAFPQLSRYVMSFGATAHEAEAIVAEVLGDCLVGGPAKRALILDYREDAALTTWLCTICRNRFYESLRKKRFVRGGDAWNLEQGLAGPVEEVRDEGLIETARRALREAFAECGAADLVLLELVYAHRVDQRRLAGLLGWTESRLSRHLGGLRSGIQRRVLGAVDRSDGALRLDWRDFVDVCETLLRRS